MTSASLDWFKSSYSGNEDGDCVEVAIAPAAPTVHIRDSKDRDGARLAFERDSWAEFINNMTTTP
ncbi:DUF397 domain-containing protein [Streptomyces sp. ISL-22]|uniref:DUF397 domain-containing protein n=1 Tax=unclassified Streptomyces TaxID=2593676 RepID=UPI001BEB6DE2|nr:MULTISPECIES: DUF397 domain-containing protein [unclassified Streptomyces]MBT2420840.1 DUF397 domain-containing protein [Streptomyces sp. ISL-24]MBT2434794.1 DUF397 domain-containing protein [Streptomyces sp. ISL-22]